MYEKSMCSNHNPAFNWKDNINIASSKLPLWNPMSILFAQFSVSTKSYWHEVREDWVDIPFNVPF